jgi:hypothetical protein
VTLAEAEPWAAERGREVLFREAVLAALGVGAADTAADDYCRECRTARPGRDCGACDRKVEVRHVR